MRIRIALTATCAAALYWCHLGILADQEALGSTIALDFKPVPVQVLKKSQPKPTWMLVKQVTIEGTPGQDAMIRLYVVQASQSVAETYAFLEDRQILYELGFISSFGAEDVKIKETNWQENGGKQWELYGALGAAADFLKIITFDRKKGRWVFVLNESANLTDELDVDGDRQNEVVSRLGAGADLTLYRWRGNHFESADIAKAIKSDYAQLFQAGGNWFFEGGTLDAAAKSDARYYRYVNGRLLRVNALPEKSDWRYF